MNAVNTYFIDVLKNHYCDFRGCATRTQFWMYFLFRVILNVILSICFSFLGDNTASILSLIVGLAFLLPDLGNAARRLHDIGRSAWWLLISFVPVIGFIVLLIFFLLPSKK